MKSKILHRIKWFRLFAICLVAAVMLSTVFTASPVQAGTGPDSPDSYTIERYYAESLGLSTTNQSSFQDKLTLTFTPAKTASYLLLTHCVLYADNNEEVEGQVYDGSTTLAMMDFRSRTANGARSFTQHKVVSLTGSTSYTYKIQWRKLLGASVGIEDTTIAVIELSSSSSSTASDGVQSTDTTDYSKVAVTHTFTAAAADYLIMASADISQASTSYLCNARLYYDTGTASWGEISYAPRANSDYGNFFILDKQTFTAGSHTFTIRLATNNAVSNASIRNARITAVKLSDIAEVHFAEATDENTNSTTDYETMNTISGGPVKLGNYMVTMSAAMKATLSYEVYSRAITDGAVTNTQVYIAQNGDAYTSSSHSDVFRYIYGDHTMVCDFRSGTAGQTAYKKDSRILAARMNTIESYSNEGHTTQSDTFSSSGAYAYIWAHGQVQSGYTYAVAYYDADGVKRYTETGLSASATGQVSSKYQLNTVPTATAGTWHAALFDTTVGSPPDSWSSVSSANGFIASDSFTVESGAVPEFPTVIAGISVAALCLAIYYWMRRKHQFRVARQYHD